MRDDWGMGDAYERYMGRWSGRIGAEFLRWLSVPGGSTWLDVGCGTGVLTSAILNQERPAKVIGIDQAAGFVEFARSHILDERATFVVGKGETLDVERDSFHAVVSGLVLNFMPTPGQAIAEMKRVAVSGGAVAVYLWDYAGSMGLLRHFWDAAVSLDPAAQELDEGLRFPICAPDPLRRLFERAGLHSIEVRAIDVETRFRGFDDYWTPFLGGQGPAPTYVTSLSDERRAALRNALQTQLPVARDGSIRLSARAWAVKGEK